MSVRSVVAGSSNHTIGALRINTFCAPQELTHLRIIISAFQILSKLSSVLHITYPALFRMWLLNNIHIISFDVLGSTHVECLMPSMGGLESKFVFTMLMPPVAMLAIILYQNMYGTGTRHKPNLSLASSSTTGSKSLKQGLASVLVDELRSQSVADASLESIDVLDSGVIISGLLQLEARSEILTRWCVVRPTRIEIFEEQPPSAECLVPGMTEPNLEPPTLRIVRIPLQGMQTNAPAKQQIGLPPFQLRLAAVAVTSNVSHVSDNNSIQGWENICIGFSSEALRQEWNAAILCTPNSEVDVLPTVPILIRSMLPVFFILYPTLTNVAFQTLSCRPLGDANLETPESVNRFDYSVDCTSVAYQKYKYGSFLSLLMYSVGIPAGFAAILWKHRSHLSRDKAQDTSTSRAAKADLDFLVGSFKPKFFMFEIVEYTRKLLLTGVLSIIAEPGSAIQSLVGVVVTFFSFALASA